MNLFQDTMDPSRVVKPLRQEGKQMVCEVYWKVQGDLNYGGTTKIPAGLFDETPQNRHIGFVSINK